MGLFDLFELEFNPEFPDTHVYTGENIKGSLTFTTRRQIDVTKIVLSLNGVAVLTYIEGSGESSTRYEQELDLFSPREVLVFPNPDATSSSGNYTLPKKFTTSFDYDLTFPKFIDPELVSCSRPFFDITPSTNSFNAFGTQRCEIRYFLKLDVNYKSFSSKQSKIWEFEYQNNVGIDYINRILRTKEDDMHGEFISQSDVDDDDEDISIPEAEESEHPMLKYWRKGYRDHKDFKNKKKILIDTITGSKSKEPVINEASLSKLDKLFRRKKADHGVNFFNILLTIAITNTGRFNRPFILIGESLRDKFDIEFSVPFNDHYQLSQNQSSKLSAFYLKNIAVFVRTTVGVRIRDRRFNSGSITPRLIYYKRWSTSDANELFEIDLLEKGKFNAEDNTLSYKLSLDKFLEGGLREPTVSPHLPLRTWVHKYNEDILKSLLKNMEKYPDLHRVYPDYQLRKHANICSELYFRIQVAATKNGDDVHTFKIFRPVMLLEHPEDLKVVDLVNNPELPRYEDTLPHYTEVDHSEKEEKVAKMVSC
ncbi:BA75_03608T0 [Komagataella pastoris]|uniref:BA75_03608T0 n=1 Tax=Komagataella pastoris TaxID=4922 RepID=A0A1B2JFW9_PICPA|nr:BA75_03608T0 [Komagataella pastoris]